MFIVQIVPRIPPAIDGLGDYALNLACQLRKNFGIETHFIVGDPTWTGSTSINGFPISMLTKRSAANLLSLLPDDSEIPILVLLHYVGYGYAKKGCPVWLVKGLELWKTQAANPRLVTIFHELYAVGPPWTSAFWLSSLQRKLAARLTQLSDRCLTSRQDNVPILRQFSLGKHTPISVLPVFSTIGEPEEVSSLAERPRRLVVFGTTARRLQVYQKSLPALERICRELEIEEVLDIGRPTGLDISEIKGIPVIAMGERSAPEINTLLLNSVAGFLDYPAILLAKSSIFAAYCAHSLIPIVVGTAYDALQVDGLEAGKHYWLAEHQAEPMNLVTAQAIANNAHTWYQTHNLSVHARNFASQVLGSMAMEPRRVG